MLKGSLSEVKDYCTEPNTAAYLNSIQVQCQVTTGFQYNVIECPHQ